MKQSKSFTKGLEMADCLSTSDMPVEKKETVSSGPRLSFDLTKEKVILDGEPYTPGRQSVIFLYVLWKAEGQPMFRSQMCEAHPELEVETHLERVLKYLKREWQTLYRMIEKTKNGYRLRKEYLK